MELTAIPASFADRVLTPLRRWRNPRNLTRIHLAAGIRRHRFEIGDHSYGAPKVRFAGHGQKLTIGPYCSFADQVEIFLSGNHRADWASTYPFHDFPGAFPGVTRPDGFPVSRGDVTIGADVWIGSGAVILSGVAIGPGAVIGARAVVTRDVAAYAVAAGNPARQLRKRFDDAIIAALLETQWWLLPPAVLLPLIPLLQSPRIGDAINAVRRAQQADGA